MKILLSLSILLFLLAACGQSEQPQVAEPTPVSAEQVEPTRQDSTPTDAASDSAESDAEIAAPSSEPTAVVAESTAEPQPTTAGETATETAVPASEPIEVTYFTPSQQEGPYYTVEKPEDRDNDLVDFAGAAGAPQGQELYFSGVVYDASGLPVEGITIEIWQTDANGAYLHPQDPATGSRDRNFQFYGESLTGPDGVYGFRTILPGLYEPRPRHIHVKVKQDGQELLTTQFYFSGEIDLQGDDAAMLISTAPAEDDAGNPILVGERDIILSINPG